MEHTRTHSLCYFINNPVFRPFILPDKNKDGYGETIVPNFDPKEIRVLPVSK